MTHPLSTPLHPRAACQYTNHGCNLGRYRWLRLHFHALLRRHCRVRLCQRISPEGRFVRLSFSDSACAQHLLTHNVRFPRLLDGPLILSRSDTDTELRAKGVTMTPTGIAIKLDRQAPTMGQTPPIGRMLRACTHSDASPPCVRHRGPGGCAVPVSVRAGQSGPERT